MKKVLWVFPYFFMPPDSGSKLRVFNLYKNLSKEFDIFLFSFYEKGKERKPNSNIKNSYICERYFSLPGGKFVKILYSIFSPTPLYVRSFKIKDAEEKIKETIKKEDIKIVQADEIYTAQYLFLIPEVKKILILHNVDSLFFWRSFLYHPNPFRKIFFLLQFFKMRRYEKKIIPKADKVFCVSEKDVEIFNRIFKGKIRFEILPNGVDTEELTLLPYQEKPILIYVGSMKYHPNILAIKWFIEKVFPLVLREIQDVYFYVIGEGGERLRRYERKYPIKFIGYTEDLKLWYEKAKITIVPLKIGSGTRLKIFESMAYGRPIVSTSIGAEGIEIKNGEEIIIADGHLNFAKSIIYLHRNKEFYEKIRINARRIVEERYDWKKISEKLKGYYF